MRAAAGEATAYDQFIINHNEALSLENLTTLLKTDVDIDIESKVCRVLETYLSNNKDKEINKNNVGEENKNKRYVFSCNKLATIVKRLIELVGNDF